MAAQIVLVRHGPSAYVQGDRMIDRVGVQRWRDGYDAAGIQPHCQPPPVLMQMANAATHIIASDLRRSVTSAERLAPQRRIDVSGLLREVLLPVPHWPTRLPLAVWELMIHVGWTYRIARGMEAAERDRVRAASAAAWLSEIVTDGSTALVITHGVFRRLVARQLVRDGWANTGRSGGYRHWSFWTFVNQRTR